MGLHEIIEAYEAGAMSGAEALELSGFMSLLDLYEAESDFRAILSWPARRLSENDNVRR
ncbi:hypothetical protein [Aureimonas sp. AU22]|uniref:hypothetical protein n=1 Tax=Aureimonas sp. AU22 TaxID=1638162 RepID=UPI000AD8774C|nr:hypothetical protein [Aureimonas sp. AU22]